MRRSRSILLVLSGLLLFSCHNKGKVPEDNNASSAKKLREKYSALLGVSPKDVENMKLYAFIDDWYGTPYKYSGKTKNGIDCSGFATVLMKEVYNKTATPPCSKMFEQCEVLGTKALEEGDLVFFKIEGNKVSHVGIYLMNNRFVHASTSKGVIISSLEENYYKKYFHKGGRLK
ncbi:MAG: NlpC/P60 family protein [Bacteroidota bacterium]